MCQYIFFPPFFMTIGTLNIQLKFGQKPKDFVIEIFKKDAAEDKPRYPFFGVGIFWTFGGAIFHFWFQLFCIIKLRGNYL
jgi:hypothetical protein